MPKLLLRERAGGCEIPRFVVESGLVTVLFHTHLSHEFPYMMEALRQRHRDHEFRVCEDRGKLVEELAGAHVLVSGPLESELLEKAPELRLQIIPFAGVNRVDLEALRRRGILLANSHGNASLVAERAVALALAAAGRVVEFDQDLRAGAWHRTKNPRQPFDYWHSLLGRPLAVLGTGAIGRGVVRLMRPFGGRITGLRRRSGGDPREEPAETLFDEVTDDLDAALRGAELVFVCLPLTPATRDLIGPRELALMKDGVLVNVSRAQIVQEEALYAALRAGALRAAGLDVWYRSPSPFYATEPPGNLPFQELKNVVLSPHAGSHAVEGKRLQLEGAIANIDLFLQEGRLLTPVDLEAGY